MAGLRLSALVFILVSAVFVGSPQARAAQGDISGNVTRVKGVALSVRNAEVHNLTEDDPVLVGDILTTGAFSRLEIKMIDGGVFTLGQRSAFMVVDYTFDRGPDSIAVRLLSGAVHTVTGRIAKSKTGSFQLETEFGTVVSRGADFWTGFKDDGALHVVLLKGNATVTTANGGKVDLAASNTGTVITNYGVAPAAPKAVPGDEIKADAAMTAFPQE